MYRWTIEYITENTDRWEKERKDREKERNDVIQEWDKKTRLEKVKTLKEKWLKKTPKDEKETENKPENWSIWREKKIEKENNKIETPKNVRGEEHQPLYPIFVNMRKPKLVNISQAKTELSQANSLPEIIQVRAPPGLPPGRCGVGLARGGAGAGGPPPPQSTSKPQKEKEHQQVYPIFMKTKDQKVAKTIKNKSQKQKKVENIKEISKGARAMEAWLKTSKVRQSLCSQTDAHRDGAEGQIPQMATQDGNTRKFNADLSDEARVCRTNPSTEKKITGRTELTNLKK